MTARIYMRCAADTYDVYTPLNQLVLLYTRGCEGLALLAPLVVRALI